MASRAEVIVASARTPRDYIAIHASPWILRRSFRRKTAKQIGRIILRAARLFEAGDDEAVLDLPFVHHIRRYSAKVQRDAIPTAVRADVLSVGVCAACPNMERLEVDHIMPWSRGGTHARENPQALCLPCNRSKWAKTMEEWRG